MLQHVLLWLVENFIMVAMMKFIMVPIVLHLQDVLHLVLEPPNVLAQQDCWVGRDRVSAPCV